MSTPSQADELPPAPRRRGRIWRLLLVVGLCAVALFLVVAAVAYAYSYPAVKAWIDSPSGQRVASQGLGKAIKVEGEFAPLHLQGWTLQTDSFTSVGWPGEVLGRLNAQDIVAEYDPSAVFNGAWRIKSIQIARAEIEIVPPNDALKRPAPPKKPRPWYLFFLPSRFECGPIICPDAKLLYQFQDQSAQISHANVQADLIGKDMKYTATSGVLEMPYLPPLHINRLEMLVTRPEITVYTAQLAGLDPQDSARVTLSGRVGMRGDKSIDAVGDLVNLTIEQVLPVHLRPLIHGFASGHLVWKRDRSGKVIDSDADLTLTGASIQQLSFFSQIKLLNDNPSLDNFSFDTVSCHFHRRGGRATLVLKAPCPGKFTLGGTVDYEFATKWADLDLTITDLPLKTWLPTEFKPRAEGFASARLQWHGRLDTDKDSYGTLSINLDGATITKPILLRRLLVSKGLRAPDQVPFKTAQFNFAYKEQTLQLTGADIDIPGMMTAHLSGSLTPEKLLNVDLAWHGLKIENWLPERLAQDFCGDIDGRARVAVREWKMENGAYGGDLKLLHGQLSYTPFQSLLARFVGDRGLLNMPLTRASLSWTWDKARLHVGSINLRGSDRLGVKGDFSIDSGNLSGVLWVGTKPAYLKSFAGLGNAVFDRDEEGLRWARVELGGTLKQPKQNFSSQLVSQLGDHPLAVFALGAKLVSWVVGDWFGEATDWRRPETEAPPAK